MSTLAQASCAHHPERRGFALCMSCRKVVCQECATLFEGQNMCRPCLLEREAAQRRTGDGSFAALGFFAAAAALALAAAYAMAWSGALTARSW